MVQKKPKKRPSKKRILQRRLIALLLITVLLGFLINLLTPSKDFSAAENRKLNQKPVMTVQGVDNGSYFTDFSSYYADQFLLRDTWIKLKYNITHLFGNREFENGYIGKSGHLFAKPTVPNQEKVDKTAAAITDFAAKHPELTQVALVAPGACAIQSQYLPMGAPVRNQALDIKNFYSKLPSTVKQVDVTAALSSHKDDYIYYKTDHHWTSLGAYTAFQAAAPYLGINDPLSYTPRKVSYDFQGTLSSRSGNPTSKDDIYVYEPQGTDVLYTVSIPSAGTKTASLYVTDALKEKDQYTLFLGGNYPLVEITTTAQTGKNLLIFKDSYANSFVPLLTSYYDKIIMIDPRYYYDELTPLLSRYGITDVLYLYSADTLLTDGGLSEVLGK